MTILALLRHGPTDWNDQKRLQGRHDLPLGAMARESLSGRCLPADMRHWPVWTSPLRRAQETAVLIGRADAVIEPALIEMDWGDYEGHRLADLRDALGESLAAQERRGLDFQPPGGESPRAVQNRLRPWLTQTAKTAADGVGITHKGVIRAVLALAHDWDMTGKAPARLDWTRLHLFRLEPDGRPRPYRYNVELGRLA